MAHNKAATERYRRRHPERRRRSIRCSNLKVRYGITCDGYDALLAEQGGLCAICGETNPDGSRLAIDHDHKTGKVRGLLCASCNNGLGRFKDCPGRLRKAADYVERIAD